MASFKNTFVAFLSGAAVGAAAALLYAPEKGEDVRKKISEGAEKVKDKAKAQWDETSSDLNDSARKVLNELEEKISSSLSSAGDKADDLIEATQKRLEELRKQMQKG